MRWLLGVTFVNGRVVLVRVMRRREFDLMITFGMNIDGVDLEEETNDVLLADRRTMIGEDASDRMFVSRDGNEATVLLPVQ